MNDATLTLVANPGSASRKYALFAGEKVLAEVCFEPQDGHVICTITANGTSSRPHVDLSDVSEASSHLMVLLRAQSLLPAESKIDRIGVRIVAPTSFFLEDHLISDDVMARLEAVYPLAPHYVATTLQELQRLRTDFPSSTIVGVSDSAFYAGKPDYAWNYGLPLQDADVRIMTMSPPIIQTMSPATIRTTLVGVDHSSVPATAALRHRMSATSSHTTDDTTSKAAQCVSASWFSHRSNI